MNETHDDQYAAEVYYFALHGDPESRHQHPGYVTAVQYSCGIVHTHIHTHSSQLSIVRYHDIRKGSILTHIIWYVRQ